MDNHYQLAANSEIVVAKGAIELRQCRYAARTNTEWIIVINRHWQLVGIWVIEVAKPSSLGNLGSIYADLEQFELAIDLLQQALKISCQNPDKPNMCVHLGNFLAVLT